MKFEGETLRKKSVLRLNVVSFGEEFTLNSCPNASNLLISWSSQIDLLNDTSAIQSINFISYFWGAFIFDYGLVWVKSHFLQKKTSSHTRCSMSLWMDSKLQIPLVVEQMILLTMNYLHFTPCEEPFPMHRWKGRTIAWIWAQTWLSTPQCTSMNHSVFQKGKHLGVYRMNRSVIASIFCRTRLFTAD